MILDDFYMIFPASLSHGGARPTHAGIDKQVRITSPQTLISFIVNSRSRDTSCISLEPSASWFNKVRTPPQSLHTRTQDTIAIPH